MELVLLQDEVVWSSAKDFGEFAARGSSKQIHLPQSIGGGGVALAKVEIFVVLRFNVRDATIVAANRDAVFNALHLNGVLLRSRIAGIRNGGETNQC